MTSSAGGGGSGLGGCGFTVCGIPMFFAQASFVALFPAIFAGAGLVPCFRHFARFPQAIMLAAISLRDYLAFAFVGLAGAFIRHEPFRRAPVKIPPLTRG